ncbi:hypothetical protein DRQ25_00400 [Candidatus Fermentibacteria bacterium]|nr:MAG: hypothetical protein DRQ25_00400 [Candidatus Fermentibacteria bacterium]
MINKLAEYWDKANQLQKATLLGLFASGMILFINGITVDSMLLSLAVCLIGGSAALLIGRETTTNRFLVGATIGVALALILSLTGQITLLNPITLAIVAVSGLASLASYELLKTWSDWNIGLGAAITSAIFALSFTGIMPISTWTLYASILLTTTATAYILLRLQTQLLNHIPQLNLGNLNAAYYPVIAFLAGVAALQLMAIIPITPTAYTITTAIDTPIDWISSSLYTLIMPAMNWVGLGGINAMPMQATTNFEGTIFTTLEFEKDTRGFTYNPATTQSTTNIQLISPQSMAITPTEYVGNPIWISTTKPHAIKKISINLKTDNMQVPVDILFNKQQATISSRYLRPTATALTEGETSQQILVKMPKGTFKVRFTAVSLSNEDAKIYASKLTPA